MDVGQCATIPHMESILEEKQAPASGTLFLDNLFDRCEIVDPAKRARTRQGLGMGLLGGVIVLNALLSFL